MSNGKLTPVIIGIMPQDQIRKRTLAIASGEYTPGPFEPKIWFSSVDSLRDALSNNDHIFGNEE